jgi:hypothetical protein
MVAAVGHGSSALWYMTRSTGLVAMVLLSATVVVGIVCSIGWASERWPRFASQALHRNLSLFALALILVHVVTTVADGFVPISILDAIIPFRSPYRPLWIGLGACAFDVLLAVAVTSGLRRRIGTRAWRTVHWLAYACWPVALFHGLGSGSDTRLAGAQVVYVVCVVSVLGALVWRLVSARSVATAGRAGAAALATLIVLSAAVFTVLGPLRPGWSRRSGTSSALLAQLSGATAPSAPARPATTGSVPALPFSSSLAGRYSISGPDAAGREQLVFSLRLTNSGQPLLVTLGGQARRGGVTMTSSSVSLGALQGSVTTLDGSFIAATVGTGATAEHLSIQLQIDPRSRAVTGSVSATAA